VPGTDLRSGTRSRSQVVEAGEDGFDDGGVQAEGVGQAQPDVRMRGGRFGDQAGDVFADVAAGSDEEGMNVDLGCAVGQAGFHGLGE
jgi:hypothetical protein